MPYKSKAQAAYMHINHPEIAKRWDKEYPNQKNLPEHVKKKAEYLSKVALSPELLWRAASEAHKKEKVLWQAGKINDALIKRDQFFAFDNWRYKKLDPNPPTVFSSTMHNEIKDNLRGLRAQKKRTAVKNSVEGRDIVNPKVQTKQGEYMLKKEAISPEYIMEKGLQGFKIDTQIFNRVKGMDLDLAKRYMDSRHHKLWHIEEAMVDKAHRLGGKNKSKWIDAAETFNNKVVVPSFTHTSYFDEADPGAMRFLKKKGEYNVFNSIFWHGFNEHMNKMAAEGKEPAKAVPAAKSTAKPVAKPAGAEAKKPAGKPGEGGEGKPGQKIDPVTGQVMFEGVKFNAGLKTEKDETKVMVQTTNPKADLKFKELASTFINKVNIGDTKDKK